MKKIRYDLRLKIEQTFALCFYFFLAGNTIILVLEKVFKDFFDNHLYTASQYKGYTKLTVSLF
ncbi:hypothetical protein C5749_15100 [Sphingobacterium gobiense]|uniref:Uncharacterized protein n=1 Tax=Sphingobacterium gobiense TaxID=1382456 RepID=A0A2S9JHU3_9SPHI|nr:hypothetical protein C5749_15100 [Sphingobacterium gobiense]